jgi:hypothetical protein
MPAMARDTYEIRVSGTLPPELLTQFGTLDVIAEPAETVLFGALSDQHALFDAIARIHDLGIQIIEVRRRTGAEGRE